jgi:hypothetical protein
MRARKVAAGLPRSEGEEAPFDMANLYPRDTGLPMTIWVSPRGRARHDARIKVCTTPGDRMDPTQTAVVAVRPQPRLVEGDLSREDFRLVAEWVRANAMPLIGYWDGQLSTVEFIQQMKRV